MDYLDFELDVEAGSDGGYVVTLDSPAGHARTEMQFPYDGLALQSRIQALHIALLRSGTKRRSGTAEDRAVADFGRDLFRSLFAGDIERRFAVTRAIAAQQDKGVRIKLRISAPEILGLPWEYLYDEAQETYLALGVGTPIVRYVPLAQSVQPLRVSPPIRILAMVAGPPDLGEIDADHERERLERSLSALRERGIVELTWVPGESWEHLQRALWDGPWHVFHFIGHGGYNPHRGTGLLYLTGDDGKSREFSAADVGVLLGDHDPLRLAVLNSCDTAQGSETDVFSSTAATLVRRGTPAVVAMQFQITDDAAIQFSRVFYEAVAHGMPVDAAVTEARKSILLRVQNTYEWGTPVLFMRSPDGVLFQVPAEIAREAPAISPARPAFAPAAPAGATAPPAVPAAPPAVAPAPTPPAAPPVDTAAPRLEPASIQRAPAPVVETPPADAERPPARPAPPVPPAPRAEPAAPTVSRYQPYPGPPPEAWAPAPRPAYAPPYDPRQPAARPAPRRSAGRLLLPFLVLGGLLAVGVALAVFVVPRLFPDSSGVPSDIFPFPPDGGISGEVDVGVSPESGSVGSDVSVSGSGFAAEETVEVRFGTLEVGEATADGDGYFEVTVTVPDAGWVFPGTYYTITAQGQSTLKWDDASYLVEE